jgi:hypothetical protein
MAIVNLWNQPESSPNDEFPEPAITGIAVENFKGIGDRVEVKFRPITLLFGANSAGKSTLLQALQYAREVFENHNLDADRTLLGGAAVDLGGFRSVVHQKDRNRQIRLDFSLACGWDDFLLYELDEDWSFVVDHVSDALLVAPTSATVSLTITWSEFHSRPLVTCCRFGFQGQHFAQLECDVGSGEVHLTNINHAHDILLKGRDGRGSDKTDAEFTESHSFGLDESLLAVALRRLKGWLLPSGENRFALGRLGDALPRRDETIRFALRTRDPNEFESDEFVVLHRGGSEETHQWQHDRAGKVAIESLGIILDKLFAKTIDIIRRELGKLRYLGPLREVPARDHRRPLSDEPSRWASGLAAWDRLEAADDKFIAQVSTWMEDGDRLDTGYGIHVKRFIELDLSDPLVNYLQTGRAFDEVSPGTQLDLSRATRHSRVIIVPNSGKIELLPRDVGTGVSQLVPVVVAAIDEDQGITTIEQPELHLHPRVQAPLGDLFIEAAVSNAKRLLIETHSEHLMLRIQRRIRESTKGSPHRGIPFAARDLAVYYVSQENGQTKFAQIDVDENGEFVQPWPDNFFEIDFYERFS